MSSIMIDCPNPKELAQFYASLINWEIVFSNEEYAIIYPPDTKRGEYPAISFQFNPNYKPPVWPDEVEAQQQMAHIDFDVNDLEKAVQHALNCGAALAKTQFSKDWVVLFDPAGHPFCLVMMKSIIDSTDYKLK
jgi:predicted enzyme related to lactoylglutathione lyase